MCYRNRSAGGPDNSLSGSRGDKRHQNHISPNRSDVRRSSSFLLLRSRDKELSRPPGDFAIPVKRQSAAARMTE
jgi:hypothetical protein